MADIQTAFKAYSPDKLDSMWAYKTEIMHKIAFQRVGGGNCYRCTPPHRPRVCAIGGGDE